MIFMCPKTIFQIEVVLPAYFGRKEIVGFKEKDCFGKRFPLLDQREDLRYNVK